MGQLINKKTVIDSETGEIVKQKSWYAYDGFNEKGYKYRRKADFIRFYFDSIPDNLSESALLLLIMLAEICNEENVLIKRVKRKSKFSNIIYKPMDKEDIMERIRFKYGLNKFDRCWKELCKHCIKRIQYHDYLVWAINPSVVSRCKQIPIWLYEEFQETLNPHLSAITLKKFQEQINNQY